MKLRYTPAAVAELAEVLDYIAERSPQAARRIQARLQAIGLLLLQHPRAGQPQRRGRLRRILVYPYPYPDFLSDPRRRDRHSWRPARRAQAVIDATVKVRPA